MGALLLLGILAAIAAVTFLVLGATWLVTFILTAMGFDKNEYILGEDGDDWIDD